jgi:acetyl-CoA acyltransferase
MKLPNDPVILGFARTPIGKYAGVLKDCRPDDLLALVFREAAQRSNIDINDIDEVVAGCANQAGEDNRNVARMAQLLAGFPVHGSAITLNRLCASGLDAVADAARKIMSGEQRVVIAGGVESMSRAPYILAKPSSAYKLGAPEMVDSSLGWRFFNEKMRTITPPEHNGLTAERLAESYGISRLRQDQFALLSHERAIKAQQNGFFDREITPVELNAGKNETIKISRDEGPRTDTSLENLAKLKAAFKEGGSVTAGNSSTLNDGAAALVIASHDYARTHGLKVWARIIGFASGGVPPMTMGIGPVPATGKFLKASKLSISDFSAVEINEAFSAQVLSVIDLLKIDEEKVNQNGGAIALGHPLGCSGARLVITLINNLEHTKKNLGLATLCVGVGQGVSMGIEAL